MRALFAGVLGLAAVAAGIAYALEDANETFATQLVDRDRPGSEPTLWIDPVGTVFVAGHEDGHVWRKDPGGFTWLGQPEGGGDATVGGAVAGKVVYAGIKPFKTVHVSVQAHGPWEDKVQFGADRPYLTGHGGRAYVLAKSTAAGTPLVLRESADGGSTWSGQVTVASGVDGFASPMVVRVLPGQPAEYNLFFTDGQGRASTVHRAAATDPLGAWTVETLPLEPHLPRPLSAAVDDDGRFYLAWLAAPEGGGAPQAHLAVRSPAGAWQQVVVSAPGSTAWSTGVAAGAGGKAGVAWYERAAGPLATYHVQYRSVDVGPAEVLTLGAPVSVGDTLATEMPETGMDILNVTARSDGAVQLAYACLGTGATLACGADPLGDKWYAVLATQAGGPRLR